MKPSDVFFLAVMAAAIRDLAFMAGRPKIA
jgi:hypothetical protein